MGLALLICQIRLVCYEALFRFAMPIRFWCRNRCVKKRQSAAAISDGFHPPCGPGTENQAIALLEKIDICGSFKQAAKAACMGYKSVWQRLDA